MTQFSIRQFKKLDVGTTVHVPINDVVRAKGTPCNFHAVIIAVEDDFYQLDKNT